MLEAAYRREHEAQEPPPPTGRLAHVFALDPAPEGQQGTDTDPVWRLIRHLSDGSPSTRLGAFDGQSLTEEPWRGRFAAAGALPHVQAAQRERAVRGVIDPVAAWALPLGLVTQRALAFAVDRVIHTGAAAGKAWVVRHAGPVRTASERAGAEATLGLPSDAPWSADHHLRLAKGLRQRPTDSPIALPGVHTAIDRMVAAGRLDPRVAPRVDRLVATASLHDRVLRPE